MTETNEGGSAMTPQEQIESELKRVEEQNIKMVSFNRGSTVVSKDVPALVAALRRALMSLSYPNDIALAEIANILKPEARP